ncbi:hypothetical protein TI03_04655 [Achromatium sp. WMS1]|nr:hypothetical protein TI03_04655 [Achromatium sp. WMS1]
MFKDPIFISIILLTIESVVLGLAASTTTKKFFNYVPAVFWIYFVPMVISSSGLIDNKSYLYDLIIDYGLPASLFLLLLGVDFLAILQLGKKGILVFLAGSLGIMLGATVAFSIFAPIVGSQFDKGFAAIAASWMGGSANMVAVKEAIDTPDNVFLPMVIVDTVVPYIWMGVLIFLSSWQQWIDTWNKADLRVLDAIRVRLQGFSQTTMQHMDWLKLIGIMIISFAISLLLKDFSKLLPIIPGVISTFTWVILLVSILGLAGSFTSLRKLEQNGLSKVGYFLLYFVLTSIGAKADVNYLGDSLLLIGAGFVIVIVHAIFLLFIVRVFKIPVMLAATASQANLGGVASGPIIAEIYQPGLSAIGLLMAILGNIMGTYLGIIVGQICRLLV